MGDGRGGDRGGDYRGGIEMTQEEVQEIRAEMAQLKADIQAKFAHLEQRLGEVTFAHCQPKSGDKPTWETMIKECGTLTKEDV